MLILLLSISGILCMALAISVLLIQEYKIKKGIIVVDQEYNGPAQVSVTLLTIIRFLLKKSVYFRKFFTQYILHILLRMMYYFDIWTTKLYSKSRNWFVKNAVRNKGTVPHFWQHLKVYKQEMDQEREQEEISK